jgi:hypothetical protein
MPSTTPQSPDRGSQGPDTARVYERAKPELESGQGRLDNNNNATPERHADRIADAVPNQQASRQINAEEEQASRPANRNEE